jgi:hypothetical protein
MASPPRRQIRAFRVGEIRARFGAVSHSPRAWRLLARSVTASTLAGMLAGSAHEVSGRVQAIDPIASHLRNARRASVRTTTAPLLVSRKTGPVIGRAGQRFDFCSEPAANRSGSVDLVAGAATTQKAAVLAAGCCSPIKAEVFSDVGRAWKAEAYRAASGRSAQARSRRSRTTRARRRRRGVRRARISASVWDL